MRGSDGENAHRDHQGPGRRAAPPPHRAGGAAARVSASSSGCPMPAVLGQVLPDGPAARAGLAAGRPHRRHRRAADERLPRHGRTTSAPRPGAHLTHRLPPRHGAAQHALEVASEEVARQARRAHRGGVSARGKQFPTACCCTPTWVPWTALGRASTEAWNMTVLQARFFWRMVIGQRVAEEPERPAVDRGVRGRVGPRGRGLVPESSGAICPCHSGS